jgi:SAM-dependent methyltransferase
MSGGADRSRSEGRDARAVPPGSAPPAAAPRYRADPLRTAPPEDRPLAFREVYDGILRGILDERGADAKALRLGANDKIARFIRGTAGAGREILEVGCAFGATAQHVARGQKALVGVDAAPVAVETARRLAQGQPGLSFEVMDATRLEFDDGRFDLVYSIDLIEHLHPDDVTRHLREVHRVLRSGGLYVVKTPSVLTGPHEGADPGTQGFLHFQEFRYGTLLPLLRATGFGRFRAPAFSMRLSCRLPGRSRYPAAVNLLAERLALIAPLRSPASKYVARVLGVKQVVVVARRLS